MGTCRRQHGWLVAALLFGALLLPFLVYYTGVLTLGPYSDGGPLGVLRRFPARASRTLQAWSSWALLLGPGAGDLVAASGAYPWPRAERGAAVAAGSAPTGPGVTPRS